MNIEDNNSFRNIASVPEYRPTYSNVQNSATIIRLEQYKKAKERSVDNKTVHTVNKKQIKVLRIQKGVAVGLVSVILLTGMAHALKKANIPEKVSIGITRLKDDDEALTLANEIIERYNYKSHLASDGIHVWYDDADTIFKRIVNAEGEFYNEPKENIEAILSAIYLARSDEETVRKIAQYCTEKRGESTGIDVDKLIGEDWENQRHKMAELQREFGSFEDYRNSLVQTKGGK